MMDFNEFLDKCRVIEYGNRSQAVQPFGEPMDCYGFVYWYYRLCRGVVLNDLSTSLDDVGVDYVKLYVPVNGCMVHMRSNEGAGVYHIGVYMNGTIHHFGMNGLMAKPLHRMMHSIKGFYDVAEN